MTSFLRALAWGALILTGLSCRAAVDPPPWVPECGAGTDALSPEALAADIAYLASDALRGRVPGTPGDEATLAFIEDRFRCLGLEAPVSPESYRQPFVTSEGDETANVVALLRGTDRDLASEIIVIGAHHDHLSERPWGIRNGANDNASGVAAVLAIARSLTEGGVVPRRTVAFVTFGFEESDHGCEGSEHFVAQPLEAVPIDRVAYMFNVDMLGTYPSEGLLTVYGALAGTPGRELLDANLAEHPELRVDLGRIADEDDSDFQAFCDAGIPYLYFVTRDFNCYHSPCDDPSNLDYPSLSAITRLAEQVLLDLADTDTDLMALRGTSATRCKRRQNVASETPDRTAATLREVVDPRRERAHATGF